MYANHFRIIVFNDRGGKWDAKVNCRYCGGNVFRTRDKKEERVVYDTEEELWDRIIEAYKEDNGATLDIHLMRCDKFQEKLLK